MDGAVLEAEPEAEPEATPENGRKGGIGTDNPPCTKRACHAVSADMGTVAASSHEMVSGFWRSSLVRAIVNSRALPWRVSAVSAYTSVPGTKGEDGGAWTTVPANSYPGIGGCRVAGSSQVTSLLERATARTCTRCSSGPRGTGSARSTRDSVLDAASWVRASIELSSLPLLSSLLSLSMLVIC